MANTYCAWFVFLLNSIEHRHAAFDDRFMLTSMTLDSKRAKQGLRKSLWKAVLTNDQVRTEHRWVSVGRETERTCA